MDAQLIPTIGMPERHLSAVDDVDALSLYP
jgi:hypothetical protein